jgi:hypothetical protein
MISAPEPEQFLSGESGTRGGRRAHVASLADAGIDLVQAFTGITRAIDRLADVATPRKVLVLSAYRADALLRGTVHELRSERHAVTLAFGAVGDADPVLAASTVRTRLRGGKFENVNVILQEVPSPASFDWTLVVDDDVILPTRFIDRFVALCGRLGLDLAQPAQTRRSHSAWRVTRRRVAAVARETRFVEIGPVTAFGRVPAQELLPFPPLRYGWGLDLHWAALAAERDWRLGILDAVPVRHERAPVAAAYDRAAAVEEAQRFLGSRKYLSAVAAQETVATHRRVPRAQLDV